MFEEANDNKNSIKPTPIKAESIEILNKFIIP